MWPSDQTAQLLGFVFAAYALGALLSALGALFDDVAEKVGSAKRFVPGLRRSAREDAEETDRLADLVKRLEEQELAKLPEQPRGKLWGKRAFWWNYLRVNCPQAVTEVDRIEAQQKLFRSLMIAWLALAAVSLAYRDFDVGAIYAALAVVSFLYYAGLRQSLSRRLFQIVVVQYVASDLAAPGTAAQ
jgi:hypothetical protein